MKISQILEEILQIQKIRYKRKGLKNTLIGLVTLLLIIKSASMVCQLMWPQKVENKQIFVMGVSCLIHFSLQFLYMLIYLPGYLGIAKCYQKYRINKGVKRAWEQNSKWPQIRNKLFLYLAINYCLIYPGMIIGSTKLNGIKLRFQNIPSTFQIAWQLLVISLIQDTVFYWLHRLSHDIKFLYKFHKVHHQYTQNFTLVTEYTHPIDYVLSILVPAAVPFMLLGSRVHCFMFFFWQVWKIYTSTESHSGYYFPWSPSRVLLCVSDSSFHDFHHSKNVGNFGGIIYLWDYFQNSCELYFSLWKKSPEHLSTRNIKNS